MSDFNQQVIEEFRTNGGKVGGMFEGAPMILITTTGAKSGERRTQPLVRFDFDGRRFIVASAAGADRHPAWFHNLVADPKIQVEVDTDVYDATATPVDRDERDALYPRVVERMPGFGDYEKKTERVIPIVEITPA